MDGAADHLLGARLGELLRRDPTLTAQQLQALVQDLLGDDLSLRAPLRELILLPAFRQLSQETSPAQAAAQRDALLAELAGTFHPDVLQRLCALLDGVLGLNGASVASAGKPAGPHTSSSDYAQYTPNSAAPPPPQFVPPSFTASPPSSSPPPSTPRDWALADGSMPAMAPLAPIPRVSPQMMERLQRIHTLVQQGYRVEKAMDAFPYLISPGGARLNPSLFGRGPAGFSWVGFFFPFVSCYQIREWSYFWVTGLRALITSLIALFTKVDVSNVIDLAIGLAIDLAYGVFMPYLRYLKQVQGGTQSCSLKRAIVDGMLLSILACIPANVVYSLAEGGQ